MKTREVIGDLSGLGGGALTGTCKVGDETFFTFEVFDGMHVLVYNIGRDEDVSKYWFGMDGQLVLVERGDHVTVVGGMLTVVKPERRDKMQRKLWKYRESFGRMGDLEGTFVATEEEVFRAEGRDVYFGEVLGKHSDVSTTVSRVNLTAVSDDQAFIDKCLEIGLVPSGFNPLDEGD